MQDFLTALFRYMLLTLLFSTAFALANSVQAQSPADAERARIMSERDQAVREWQLRNLGKVKRVDVEVAPSEVSLAKVKEDYEGIQVANNNILKMLSAGKGLDYKMLFDATSEIRKRAGRLGSYIVAMQSSAEEDKKRRKNLDEIEPEEMKASLLSLDASIVSLIKSPIFKNFGKVVDATNSGKALDDVENIIDLSDRIKRSIERSLKAARASR